jgi:UDP-N-acetylmuramoyl-tripeptide--D-alanyl-D-alanine ligase
MPTFSPEVLAQWAGGRWQNGMPAALTGITQDTRSILPRNLYVAIRGERFDGHDFIDDAFAKGAAGAMVCSDYPGDAGPVLAVSDTLDGLQQLAAGYRKEWNAMVVGITGSVGKTTVKEMCADVLSMAGETHRTAGNYNNHIGLPLTMLAMPETAQFGVFEIGMNRPGEIGPLTGLLQPQIGILTDICNAHRESFSSLEEIAREKIELIARVPTDGFVVVDADSEWFPMIREKTAARIVTVSLEGEADYAGGSAAPGEMQVNGFDYAMPQAGRHIMVNALRAIALGSELGLAPDQINEGLEKFQSPPMRWEPSEIGGIKFINDAYNANPLSMRASLRTFTGQVSTGKRWAVLGGMRELGDAAEEEHAALGRFIDGLDLDGVVLTGELAQLITVKAQKPLFKCAQNRDVAQVLRDNLKPGDSVLLKASRGEQLETVLDCFKEM